MGEKTPDSLFSMVFSYGLHLSKNDWNKKTQMNPTFNTIILYISIWVFMLFQVLSKSHYPVSSLLYILSLCRSYWIYFQKIYMKSNLLETKKRIRLFAIFCDRLFGGGGRLNSRYEKSVCKSYILVSYHTSHKNVSKMERATMRLLVNQILKNICEIEFTRNEEENETRRSFLAQTVFGKLLQK